MKETKRFKPNTEGIGSNTDRELTIQLHTIKNNPLYHLSTNANSILQRKRANKYHKPKEGYNNSFNEGIEELQTTLKIILKT